MLVVDDLHEADEASMRLLHYLARSAAREPVLVVVAHRPLVSAVARRAVDSLVRPRAAGAASSWSRCPRARRGACWRSGSRTCPRQDTDRIVEVSGGIPFLALELARQPANGAAAVLPALPPAVLRTFERVALLGSAFTTDELLAVSGASEEDTYRHLDDGLSEQVVEPADLGYRFRHALVREALIGAMTPAELGANRRGVAEALAALAGPPGRVAHHFLAAGLPGRAVPFAVRAVESAGALGAYRDALALVDAVRAARGPRGPAPAAGQTWRPAPRAR